MTVYLLDNEQAPNPRRVRIFLAEKGITVENRQLNIMKGEHLTPELKQLNPFQRLPILVLDDGRTISETMAICRYFDAIHPKPELFGRDDVDCAIVEMWQRRIEHHLYGPISYAFRHGHPAMAKLEVPQVKKWAEANIDKAKWMMGFLNEILASQAFIAGANYTVADITAQCSIDFMRVIKLQIDDSHKNLKHWHDEVSARPSARM